MRFFPASLAQHRILGGAIVLAVTQIGASIMGLIRDRVLAGTFPDLTVVDAYIAAFRPADLLFQMTIMAGFSVGLVPLLAQYHAHGDRRGMNMLFNGVVGAAALFFIVIALAMAGLFPWIAPYLVQFEGEQLSLYTTFVQWVFLSDTLFVFGNAHGQYLITIQRYWIYGLTPILYSLGTILGTLFLTPLFGAYGPMLGSVLGAVLYTLVRFASLLQVGYRPGLSFWHPDLPEFFRLMVPRTLALGALHLQLLLFDTLASGLPSGAVTINAYARNFQSVIVGAAGIALAQSAFSLLSQAAARREIARFRTYLRKGMALLLLLTIPGAITLVLLGPIAARLVNLTHVYPVFALCLALYAVSIPFESLNHLLLRAFYATKQTVIPALFDVLAGALAVALAWSLAGRMEILSLPIGFTAGQVLLFLGLVGFLPGRIRAVAEEKVSSRILFLFKRAAPPPSPPPNGQSLNP